MRPPAAIAHDRGRSTDTRAGRRVRLRMSTAVPRTTRDQAARSQGLVSAVKRLSPSVIATTATPQPIAMPRMENRHSGAWRCRRHSGRQTEPRAEACARSSWEPAAVRSTVAVASPGAASLLICSAAPCCGRASRDSTSRADASGSGARGRASSAHGTDPARHRTCRMVVRAWLRHVRLRSVAPHVSHLPCGFHGPTAARSWCVAPRFKSC